MRLYILLVFVQTICAILVTINNSSCSAIIEAHQRDTISWNLMIKTELIEEITMKIIADKNIIYIKKINNTNIFYFIDEYLSINDWILHIQLNTNTGTALCSGVIQISPYSNNAIILPIIIILGIICLAVIVCVLRAACYHHDDNIVVQNIES